MLSKQSNLKSPSTLDTIKEGVEGVDPVVVRYASGVTPRAFARVADDCLFSCLAQLEKERVLLLATESENPSLAHRQCILRESLLLHRQEILEPAMCEPEGGFFVLCDPEDVFVLCEPEDDFVFA